LAITWKSVKEELMKSSELQKYQVLFYEVVKILAFDLNAYAFEGRIVVSEESLQQLSDTTILDFVPSVDKRRLLFLLSDFANDKEYEYDIFSQCSAEELFADITYDLMIPVSIPNVDILHEVELQLESSEYFTVGQTIATKLIITSDKKWAASERGTSSGNFRFLCEIIAPPETWVLSGKKKSYFEVHDTISSIHSMDFTLIPLRSGSLQLPKIEIARVVYAKDDPNIEVKSEIDFKNGLEAVLVAPLVDRVTVSM
jgi:hypothetical protein